MSSGAYDRSHGTPWRRVPVVLVAVRHPAMRRLTCDVLGGECDATVCEFQAGEFSGETLAAALQRSRPDVLIIDGGDFPSCYHPAPAAFPPGQAVVVGLEPEADYRSFALAQGAGAWISRDRLSEDLPGQVRRLLSLRPGMN